MLLGAAVGGALGEAWHRRADRAMLDVVAADDIDTSDVRAGHGARPVDD
jgi:hypothetical protein